MLLADIGTTALLMAAAILFADGAFKGTFEQALGRRAYRPVSWPDATLRHCKG